MLVAILQTAVETHAVSPLAILAALLGLQVLAFFWSCFPCCESCTLFADSFDRANTTTLSDYTETVGDWQVTSNRLDPPANGLLKVNLSTPVSPDGVRVSVVFNFGGATGEMSVMVDYVDASNYHYAEVICTGSTSATLQIVQVTGGVPTDLTTATSIPSFSWSADRTLTVCWDGEYIAATIGTIAAPTLTDAATTTGNGGNFTGLRCLSVGTSARFDDLNVSSMAEGCQQCSECDACSPDLVEVQVDLAGFADGTCTCSLVNGTHFLPIQVPQHECFYEKRITHSCGAMDYFAIGASLDTSADEIRVAVINPIGGTMDCQFLKSGIGTCADWDGLDVPLDSYTPSAACGASTPTAAITAA
jgi:hypothetical protein